MHVGKKAPLLFLALGLLASLLASAQSPVSPAPAATDPRIEALIARMTVEEKVGQLSLYGPADTNIPGNPQANRRNAQLEADEVRAGRVTGLFNNEGLTRKRELQRIAVQESRLGIPLIFGADVIHGFRTIFPMPLAEASSWEPALAERTARAAAVEASADGFRWTFAPMVDIARDARWGRGIEGVGEDPLLASRFAAARVRGFQGDDLSRADAMLATPKHFAGYGAAEGGLDYNTVDISERTLREVYLPPFRAALDAGALSLMSGFHEISGIPSTANPALLTGVLRGEWGFRGFVVSDYTADEELIAHGYAANGREAAKQAFLAGTDMSMQSGLYMRELPGLVAAGEVPMARLDDAVALHRLDQIGRDPDMVEPAALVRYRPVARAIAPPGVEPLRRRIELPADIDPAMRVLQRLQPLDLDRGVADGVDQLLVAPHVRFERGDVEIAQDDRAPVQPARPLRHAFEEIELLAEFGVEIAVGNLAAGGHIDIFQPHRAAQGPGDAHPDMPRLAIGLPVEPVVVAQPHLADDRYAMVHRLAVKLLEIIAELAEGAFGKVVVDDLGFLKAQDVGLLLGQEPLHRGQPEADRVDVPRSDFERGSHGQGSSQRFLLTQALNVRQAAKNPRPGGIGTRVLCCVRHAWVKPVVRPGNRGKPRRRLRKPF